MDREGLEIDVVTPGDIRQANPQEARKLSVERCVQALNHAYRCCDTYCRLWSCEGCKRVFTHMTFCKRKTNANCPVCKQVIMLCCYHARRCTESTCSVPFCSRIKERIREQEVQQQQPHAAQLLQPRARAQHQSQHRVHVNALQQIMAILNSSTGRNQQRRMILQILKSFPSVMVAVFTQIQYTQNQQQVTIGFGHVGNVGNPGVGVVVGGGVQQQQPHASTADASDVAAIRTDWGRRWWCVGRNGRRGRRGRRGEGKWRRSQTGRNNP